MIAPSAPPSAGLPDRGSPATLSERSEFMWPAGLADRSEGSPQGRGGGARFFGYFLVA